MNLLCCFCSDLEEVQAKPGDDVTLSCQGPREAATGLLKWIRRDLKSDGYVFFYRDGTCFENYQHPYFRGRVSLRDESMKDGDVSVILKTVNINDTGLYECQNIIRNTEHSEGTPTEVRHLINLKVLDSGEFV